MERSMEELKNYENRRRKRFGRLRELFEEIQTMKLMGYSVEDMTNALEDRQTDEVYFANQYLDVHNKSEDLETVIRKAYELLYSEEPPILKTKNTEHNTEELPKLDRKSMLERCTERLIKAFIRDRIELVVSLLASDKFNNREFAALGYDREYLDCLVRTVKLFSPTREIKMDMLQDRKRMTAIIDRVYEELYVLTKRQRMWTCDWLDFEGLQKYEAKEEEN